MHAQFLVKVLLNYKKLFSIPYIFSFYTNKVTKKIDSTESSKISSGRKTKTYKIHLQADGPNLKFS